MKAKLILLWIIIKEVYFSCVNSESSVNADVQRSPVMIRRIARQEGDVILGALFPIHKAPSDTSSYTRTCGEIWEQYGIHRTEIFLKTVDEINADPDILQNITLGYDIRDSCWYSPIALEQSIDFIKDSLASLDANRLKELNSSALGECSAEAKHPIVGLIGPGTSSNTMQVQNLLQIFNIPQIGYSATSMALSDKNLYKYFLRVVPSDRFQAQTMLDIVLRYNWTYITAVHSDDLSSDIAEVGLSCKEHVQECTLYTTTVNYGSKGIEMFMKLARNNSICIANDEGISSQAPDDAYDQLVKNIMKTENARVLVCFCEGLTVIKLMEATMRVPGAKGRFLILGSDGWADRPDVVLNREDAAAGGMSIKLHSPTLPQFDKFFLALDPFNNTRNPWYKEFWQHKFKCSIPGDDFNPLYENKTCTGKEFIDDVKQDSKLGFVVNAIYAMAYALHNLHNEVCDGVPGMCEKMKPIEGSLYLEHLLNVSMTTYSDDQLHFDENGDPPARYDIINYQKIEENGNITYGYRKVGSWDTGELKMNDADIYWPDGRNTGIMKSVCSEPCPKGHIKNIKGNVKCCWICIPCKENEFMTSEENCQSCPLGWWPNEELTACKIIPTEYLSWFDTEAVVAISMACFGIFVTLWISVIFIRHHNTPVVKASTRELSYIIMIGIIIAFSCNFVLVSKPTIVTCYFTRILPGLSFSLIYGALVTKTNRIARILEGTKKIITKKPRFMSASAQVIITCILVGIECAIITVMLIIEPADSKLDYPSNKRVRLVCNTTTLGIVVPLGFDLVLILMCTLYAVKTRNLPENFNEAKFIGFTMYTTCVIWLGFFAIYFGSEARVLTMSVSISLSASVALVLLFFPKIYVIVWAPEKNTRSAFTTSKDVRCHIGSISFHSGDSMDMMRGKKTMDGKQYRRRSIFGKTRQKPKDAMVARKQSASLPPNIRLNRQNSTHVPANTNSNSNQKFPWTTKDRSPSEDVEDRLSTISSKEESHGSDKKKGYKKQDSQCQTESEMFESYLIRSKSDKKKSSVRRRQQNGRSNDGVKCESDSSIDSDEIFLSLPPADSREKRGMYKTPSPAHHSDRSPLLNVVDVVDNSYSVDGTGVTYKNEMNDSYNLMSNFQKQTDHRDKNLVPYSPSYHVTENVQSSADQQILPHHSLHSNPTINQNPPSPMYAVHCNHGHVNGPYFCSPSAHHSATQSGEMYQLRPNESELYGRRHSEKNRQVQNKVSPSIKRRNTNPDRRSPRQYNYTELPQPYQGHPHSSPAQPFCCQYCGRQEMPDIHKCNTYQIDNSWVIPSPPSAFKSHPPEVMQGRPADPVPNLPSSSSSSSKGRSSMLPEDTVSSGLNRLDEEEVSMISFQTYLKNHGLDLDMSSVQSSDV